MGNRVCGEADSGYLVSDQFLQRHSSTPDGGHIGAEGYAASWEAAPGEVTEPWCNFDHNIKLLCYTVAQPKGSTREVVICETSVFTPYVSLDRSEWELHGIKADATYVALRVSRSGTATQPAAATGIHSPVSAADLLWAQAAEALMYPEGLQEPYGEKFRGLSCLGSHTHFALYVVVGRRAPPVTALHATLGAIQIERRLLDDPKLVERLFRNGYPTSPSSGPSATPARTSTTTTRSSSPVFPITPPPVPSAVQLPHADLTSLLRSNHLFRSLHRHRAAPDSRHILSPRAAQLSANATPLQEITMRIADTVAIHDRCGALTYPKMGAVAATGTWTARSESTDTLPASASQSARGDDAQPFKVPVSVPPISSMEPSCEGLYGAPVDFVDQADGTTEVLDDRAARLRAAAPEATQILDHLFVGGEAPSRDKELLLTKGITHIINCASSALPNEFPELFDYTALPLGDSPDEPILTLIPQVVNVIERVGLVGGKVLVHCHQGVSRSCSFVIAYCMWKMGVCYDVAYKFVRERRNVASPNPGFYVNLLKWQRRLEDPRGISGLWRLQPYRGESLPLVWQPIEAPISLAAEESAAGGDSGDRGEGTVVLDTSTCYVVVAADLGRVVFLRGADCEPSCASDATDLLQQVLHGGFYRGKESTSETSAHRTVVMRPPWPASGMEAPQVDRTTFGVGDYDSTSRILAARNYTLRSIVSSSSTRSEAESSSAPPQPVIPHALVLELEANRQAHQKPVAISPVVDSLAPPISRDKAERRELAMLEQQRIEEGADASGRSGGAPCPDDNRGDEGEATQAAQTAASASLAVHFFVGDEFVIVDDIYDYADLDTATFYLVYSPGAPGRRADDASGAPVWYLWRGSDCVDSESEIIARLDAKMLRWHEAHDAHDDMDDASGHLIAQICAECGGTAIDPQIIAEDTEPERFMMLF